MKLLISVFLGLLLNNSLAQKTTITITDSLSSLTLSDATITYYNKNSVYCALRSNENGSAILNLPEIGDSISISHVGYLSKTVSINAIKVNSTISLSSKTKQLVPVLVKTKIETGSQKIGKFGKTRTNFFSYHYHPCAMSVTNLDSDYIYKVKSLTIGLRLNDNCSHGISINFFNTNEMGKPHLADYNNEIILMPDEINSDPLTIDLTTQNIFIYDTAFAVSVHLISYKECTEIKGREGLPKGTCFKNYIYDRSIKFWNYNYKKKIWGLRNYFPENTNPALGIELLKFKK
jgi:hypothetical protein